MSELTLLYSTGEAKADAVIRGAIGILERVFPQRIGGYYLVGSYADGSYVPTSDLDIVPIFKGSMTGEEEAAYWDVIHNLDLISPIHLGFGLRNEAASFAEGGVGIKIGSELLYGEDVRDKIPLWPLDVYVQYMIGAHLKDMHNFRDDLAPLRWPLAYPDPNGEFYGYDQLNDFHNQASGPGTGALFGHIMVMASTLVTLKTGEYNASKSRSHEFYRRHIHDGWIDFLESMYEQVKKTWHYRVPTALPDRLALRALCEQALAFENHFLDQVRPYLFQRYDANSAWAAKQLGKITFPT